MPLAAIGIGLGTAIAGGAAAGATVYGAHKTASAATKAAGISAKGADQALAFEREQAAEDRRRYDQQQTMQRQQWDAEQQRRAPYRAAAASILSRRTGIPTEPYQPTFAPKTLGQLAGPQAGPRPSNPNTLGALAQQRY